MSKDLRIDYGPYGFEVKYNGGGQRPESLTGYFTSPAEAQKAIDAYLTTKKPRAKKNGTSKVEHREEQLREGSDNRDDPSELPRERSDRPVQFRAE